MSGRRIADDEKAAMREMHAEGLSYAEIARRTGFSQTGVGNYIRSTGKGRGRKWRQRSQSAQEEVRIFAMSAPWRPSASQCAEG